MLKYALWADRITTEKEIGSSPFQLVYGTDAVFSNSARSSNNEIISR